MHLFEQKNKPVWRGTLQAEHHIKHNVHNVHICENNNKTKTIIPSVLIYYNEKTVLVSED